jgi:hypothetical protein
MAKYIFRLRRGWKGIDKNGNTTYADGTPVDDWAKYELDPNHVRPHEGELVLEYDNGVPRLKIGDGIREFSALPYMSVDSFILPTPATVTLKAKDENDVSMWTHETDGEGNLINRYSQVVKDDSEGINQFTNATITPNSKIDLQPDPDQLVVFHEKDLAFVTENDGGKVTVYCIGQQPQNDYTIQVTVTEVALND